MTEIELKHNGKGEGSTLGWIPPLYMSWEEWLRMGQSLRGTTFTYNFLVGDWLAFGRKHYGEGYRQAMNLLDIPYHTLNKFKSVAERIPPEERRIELSWTHHFTVAYLPNHEERWQALDLAVRYGLSKRELESIVALPAEARDRLFALADQGIEKPRLLHLCRRVEEFGARPEGSGARIDPSGARPEGEIYFPYAYVLAYIVEYKREHDGNSPTPQEMVHALRMTEIEILENLDKLEYLGAISQDRSGFLVHGGTWSLQETSYVQDILNTVENSSDET